MGIKAVEALVRGEDESDEDFEARKAAAMAEADPEPEEGEGESGEPEEELLIAIGAEPSPRSDPEESDEIDGKPAPQWVKDLREKARQDTVRIRELETQLKQQAPAKKEPEPIIVGPKPTMETCDYDNERFERELSEWMQRDADAKRQTQEREAAQRKEQEAWAAKQQRLTTTKATLVAQGVKGVDDAFGAAEQVLTPTQRGIIVSGSKNPALVFVALGKTPEKLKELSAIQDPIDFAFAVARVEDQVKTKSAGKTNAGTVDRSVRGNSGSSATIDRTLARLRAEAEATGNYTKVAAYKRELAAGKSK